MKMEYFKHDINASEDDKICELLASDGYEMLGYYWRFIEYLYSRGGKVDSSKLKSVCWTLHMDIDKLNHLIYDFGLFHDDAGTIYSKRVLQEVNEFEAVGKRMAEIGKAGGKASAKARGSNKPANSKPDAKPDGQAHASKNEADGQAHAVPYAEPDAKPDGQQNKKIKEKKENKKNTSVPSEPKYDDRGRMLNSAGLPIIDWGIGKYGGDF